MADSEITQDGVERLVGERKPLCIGLTKVNTRIPGSGYCDHTRSQVDPNNGESTTVSSGCGNYSWAGRYVQNTSTGTNRRRVEQGLDGIAGHLGKKIAIAFRNLVVSGAFEGLEIVHVDRGSGHRMSLSGRCWLMPHNAKFSVAAECPKGT